MPPMSASWLYRPLKNSIFSRNGRKGSSTLPSSILSPSPLAHHSLLWKPLPANRQAKRTGGSEARSFGFSSPQTGTDSNHGSAIVTPRQRKNARRDRGKHLEVT